MKSLLSLFILIIAVTHTYAQFDMEHVILESDLKDPEVLSTADLDGDGDQDILAFLHLCCSKSRLVWYENTGNGNWGEQHFITDEFNNLITPEFQLGDLQNDNDIDLVISKNPLAVNQVFINDGNGGFSLQTNLAATRFLSLAIGDLNNDNFSDIVAGTIGDDVLIYHGLPGGTFELVDTLFPSQLIDLILADIDQDDLLDILVTDNEKIFAYANNNGEFSDEYLFASGLNGNYYTSYLSQFTTINIHDDSSTHFLYLMGESLKLHLTDNEDFDRFNLKNDVIDFSIADVNADGKDDICFLSRDQPRIGILYQQDNATFAESFVTPGSDITTLGRGIAAADLNADGDMDIAFADYSRISSIEWMEQIDSTDFQRHLVAASPIGSISSPVLADITNDGENNIIYFEGDNLASSGLLYWQGIEEADFSTRKEIITDQLQSFVLGDFNADNWKDIVMLSGDPLGISYYKNSAGVQFEMLPIGHTQSSLANGLSIADIDNDGDDDIIYLDIINSEKNIIVYKNQNGLFATDPESIYILPSLLIYQYRFRDMDNDNSKDIVFLNTLNDQITWVKNTNGTFTAENNTTIALTGFSGNAILDINDYNQDGYNDLVLLTQYDTARIYLNDQMGGFDPGEVIFSTANGMRAAISADINNDGWLDFVISAQDDFVNKILIRTGIENGSYNDAIDIKTFDISYPPIQVKDVDLDGDLDIFYSRLGLDKLAWLENNTITLNIHDHFSNVAISAFPNPMTEMITIQLEEWEDQKLQLNLYSIDGQLTDQFEFVNNKLQLYRASFNGNGLYIFNLINDKGAVVYSGKIEVY